MSARKHINIETTLAADRRWIDEYLAWQGGEVIDTQVLVGRIARVIATSKGYSDLIDCLGKAIYPMSLWTAHTSDVGPWTARLWAERLLLALTRVKA